MLAILERSKQPDNIMDSAIATKDSRENIKAEIVSWVKAEMPKAPLFQQRDIVASTLKSLSRGPYAKDEFSPSRQLAFVAFQERFEAVLESEQLIADEAIGSFYLECIGIFGEEFREGGIDSSCLPWLQGTDKQMNWAFVLRSNWFRSLQSLEEVELAKDEIMENRSAQYWIKKLK